MSAYSSYVCDKCGYEAEMKKLCPKCNIYLIPNPKAESSRDIPSTKTKDEEELEK